MPAWVGVSEGAISCDNYNPVVCFPDLRGVCLTNGTMMTGTCPAQAAICREGAKEATDMGCCAGTAPCVPLNSSALPMPGLLCIALAVGIQYFRNIGF
ncbi:hypothetical protein ACOMHN_047081 [Nucella lapillus]